MKWFSSKYSYLLVTFVIIVTLILQLAWLDQLYNSQSVQVKRDIEAVMLKSSKLCTFEGAVPQHKHSAAFQEFMLSDEWMQLRQAYYNIRFHQISSSFYVKFGSDSNEFILSLKFPNDNKIMKTYVHRSKEDDDEPTKVILLGDKTDLKRMDSIVSSQMALAGLKTHYEHALYYYDNDQLVNKSNQQLIANAAYVSSKYPYNLRYVNTYQLIVPSLFSVILSRMKLYLISSSFMLLLTCAVFYFILRLMRNQRRYAQARVAFVSNMTHELKTPVAIVAVALSSIKKYKLVNQPEKLERYIDISEKELKRLTVMIENVLNLEQVENGITKLKPELYDIQEGLRQIVSSMRLRTEKGKSKIIFKPSAQSCFVNADPVHLTNAFYNLIDNAIKYGGPDVTITISCICEDNIVIISFQDNGPGIEAVYHHQIFDRFFRIQENENIHNVKGTGLGLYYVKNIINQSGGEIILQSHPGKGSNFIVNLPVSDDN